jgi:hypothetical protein
MFFCCPLISDLETTRLQREFWRDFLVGSVIATILLLFLEIYSEKYWLFAISALMGWSVGSLIFKGVGKQPAVHVRDFLGFTILVIVVTIGGAWLSSSLLQGLSLIPNGVISSLIINFVAAALTFLASSYDIQYWLEYGT